MGRKDKLGAEDALQRLLEGQETDGGELQELDSMARMARAMQAGWQEATPRPDFEASLRYQFVTSRVPRGSFLLGRILPLALRAVGGAVLLLVAASGLFSAAHVASADALPGDALYAVKRAVEATRLMVPAIQEKSSLRASFADRRLQEIEKVHEQGRTPDPGLMLELARETESLAERWAAPDAPPDLGEKVIKIAERHEARLEEVVGLVPEPARDDVLEALEVSRRGHDRALEVQRERAEAAKAKELEAKKPEQGKQEKEKGNEEKGKPRSALIPSPAAIPTPTSKASPTVPSVQQRFDMSGIVKALRQDRLTVDDKEVRLAEGLVKKGLPNGVKVGARVRVEGVIAGDGQLEAQEITVLPGTNPAATPKSDGGKPGQGKGGQQKEGKDD